MASIEDRWKGDGKAALARKGKGMRYRVRYTKPNGKPGSKSFPDKKKREAEKFAATVTADVLRGSWIDPDAGKITVREHAERWLSVQTCRASSLETYRHRITAHVYPALGDRTLGELAGSPSLIQAWVKTLPKGSTRWSPSSRAVREADAGDLRR